VSCRAVHLSYNMPPSALLVLRRGSLVAHINDVSVLQAVADAMLLTAAANVATQGGPELEGALAEHEDALRAARQHRGATIVADAVAELIKMEPCAAASRWSAIARRSRAP